SYTVSFGSPNNDDAINVSVADDHSAGLSLARWDATNGHWVVRHANASNRTPVRYTTNLNTTTAGRSAALGGGEVLFAQGIFLGSGLASVRKQTNATSTPSTGVWARGDIVWNRDPSAGGF